MTKQKLDQLKRYIRQELANSDKQSKQAYVRDQNIPTGRYYAGQAYAYADILTSLRTLEQGGDLLHEIQETA